MECLICNVKCETLMDVKMNVCYYDCPNCKFIFKDKKHYISSAKEKERYDMHNNCSDNYKLFFDNLLNKVAYYSDSGIGLDYGCGPYPVLYNLLSEKYEMYKYDLYYDNNFEYSKNIYDFITLTEVIEHLGEPLEVLKEIEGLLKPGGYLYVMTELTDGVSFLDWWYRRDITHICFYNSKTFKEIEKLLDFKVIICEKNLVVLRRGNNASN